MSLEENKALVCRYFDQLANHGPEAAVAIIDERMRQNSDDSLVRAVSLW